MKLLLAFLIVSIPAYGQLISDSLQTRHLYRTFHFNKPAQRIQNGSLVFILHGSGGHGRLMMGRASKLEALSATERILLVYPDGYKNFWNECRKTANSAANLENIDEEGFFSALIEYFSRLYGTSEKKVFVIGTSGGGHMAYKLALTMPGKVTAISALIANLPDTSNMDCKEAGIPVPVMIVNGTADSTNPYNGGMVSTRNIRLGYVRSTDNTISYWTRLAGHKDQPVMDRLPDKDTSDGKTIERYSYIKKGKTDVVLYKVIGGKHDYPNDIDVYLESWNFFKRQLNR